jgi:hypothetical protein
VRVTQKFGIGLTICLKENGVRRVSRDLKERDQSREQWVPHVSISNKAGESIRLVHPESLVGSPSRPTFEVGESSSEAQTLIGNGPVQKQASYTTSNITPNSLIRVIS